MDWTHVAPRGVAVKEVAGGLGLVALRDISEGELFFREAPFAVLRAASLQEACTTDPEMMELIAQVRVARAGVRGGRPAMHLRLCYCPISPGPDGPDKRNYTVAKFSVSIKN